MDAKRTRLWRRLGSIAGVGLAVASALVLAGGAPGAQLAPQRSFDASADLSITVNHQPEPAKAYDVVGFHMQVTNPSDTIAQGVSITVDVPPSDWIAGCNPPGGATTIYCSIGNVNPHTTVTIDLSLRVHPNRGDVTATVSSAATPDPDLGNNTATDIVSILPRDEDLGIGVQGIPSPVLAGDELTIRSVVTDYGPDDAYSPPDGEGVQVDVQLPAELTILSISPGVGGGVAPFCTNTYATDQHIRCRLPTLPRDQSVAVEIKVRPAGSGTLHFEASVGSGFIAEEFDEFRLTTRRRPTSLF